MLHPGANKAKAQLTADPRRNPKNKAAANHYMQQRPIQHKASATMNRIESAAKKHRIKNVRYSSLIDSFDANFNAASVCRQGEGQRQEGFPPRQKERA